MENDINLDELRIWFFKENIRINEENLRLSDERDELDREREKLKREEELFEKKLEILKKELYQLANEKKALEKERQRISELKSRTERDVYANRGPVRNSMFFSGVGSELALKKRYKDLLKIYHPDNLCGDTDTVQYINKEYDSLRRNYCG